jgi:cytochrome c peroxidase
MAVRKTLKLRTQHLFQASSAVKSIKFTSLLGPLLLFAACGGGGTPYTDEASTRAAAFTTKEALGESLYSDTNLSLNCTQSCATCHNPEHAFIDDRRNDSGEVSAVSLGDDGVSLGDRNSPTAAYARFIPEFKPASHARFNSQQPDYDGFVGGQFLDGRENNLEGQAGGPPTNPLEMGMPDKNSVIERIKENENYMSTFEALYGSNIFDDIDEAYHAMTDSIAAFERTESFAPFSSKYDKSLTGDYAYDPLSKAAAGKALFFSQQFTNCATCHQLKVNGSSEETFTNYEYHNIGVPSNQATLTLSEKDDSFTDNGLLDNPQVTDANARGKFKVPTLRNSAVTGPYMHNGVFKNLKTVIQFYDHFLLNSDHTLNPETGQAWRPAEIEETVSETELADGRKLSADEVEALVCFLRTLTDERWEHLIEHNGVDCGED